MTGSETQNTQNTRRSIVSAFSAVLVFVVGIAAQGAAPVIVVETNKGTFSIETFPEEAPKTVAHIVELASRGFYDGQRIHRAIPGFLVQWGDPRSADPGQESEWGLGPAASSGTPIGVSEITKKHPNVSGAVGVAHDGNPAHADSQVYITLADRPDLNGRYTVFGAIATGADVPSKLERGDFIRRVYVNR